MIMALCLLVYNLGQRQLRQALAQNEETIPNQLGQLTASPTLRWVFQCFMAVHLVVFQRAFRGFVALKNIYPDYTPCMQRSPSK
jgi:transposase